MTNSIKLQYSVEYLNGNRGNTSGILFNTEEQAWSYLDLVALQGTILEASISEVPTPRKREVYATTRSWE
jgi:hypothetical protein